jgi:16S rRNA (uracil1498-N3)-methyltransferase
MNELLFFENNLELKPEQFTLYSEEAHHIIHVLRLKEGKKIFLTDGKGSRFYCEILSIKKKSIELKILEKEHFEQKEPKINIAIGPVKKRDANEWMVEKLTELGVNSIHFFSSQNGERAKLNIERLKKISVSACKQSMNLYLPEMHDLQKFEDCISLYKNYSGRKFIAYCGTESNDFISLKYQLPENTIIFIGPEGGFDPKEIDFAKQIGFETINLGTQRLRTETAAIFAVSAINSKFIA